MVANSLQRVHLRALATTRLAQSREVEADGSAGKRLQNMVEGAADETEVEDDVPGALGDALLQDGIDKLPREPIHGFDGELQGRLSPLCIRDPVV